MFATAQLRMTLKEAGVLIPAWDHNIAVCVYKHDLKTNMSFKYFPYPFPIPRQINHHSHQRTDVQQNPLQ